MYSLSGFCLRDHLEMGLDEVDELKHPRTEPEQVRDQVSKALPGRLLKVWPPGARQGRRPHEDGQECGRERMCPNGHDSAQGFNRTGMFHSSS